ncbi:hypothetical protein [Novosphingobium ginsenosidimutans]|uniref:Uncharacterized protein n=1 Tax=Novosphingobium ginsenosidimutans TaxID=1176536 RepID=A0A5B8S5B9_9SPHN|nr:hypothetical protein [Novosphingobium ginsenosidimutans]QEA15937.1 hypothetical protein FRF71_07195 [Novosphingobium ginsenosidimutans]
MLILYALLSAAPTSASLGPAWATFSRDPQLRAFEETVEIGTLGLNRETGQLEYWMRRTVTTAHTTKTSWADSRTCAEVRPAVEGMENIRIPSIHSPSSNGKQTVTLDGTIYRLAVPSTDGRIEFDGNIGSSVGGWIDASLLSLEKCWSEQPPSPRT